MGIDELLNIPQYSLSAKAKQAVLAPLLHRIHLRHLNRSLEFKHYCETAFPTSNNFSQVEDFPFLPVSAFKNHSLKSISSEEVFKVLTSSGTTGQAVSRIYLDKATAKLQTLSLSKIINHVVGQTRLPMLIVDSKAVFANKNSFSARGAGILGLSVFGKDHTYVLDDNFELDHAALLRFLDKYDSQPVLIFGFTFMVWQFLYQVALTRKFDLSKAILLHSGGWKKLTDISVDNYTFRTSLHLKFGIRQVYNFYGMVEQVGSVFLENSDGWLQCPNFADVIIRNPGDFSVQPDGTEGLIQVISVLPESYPGHSILTEDIGIIMGRDNASNGWKGNYFKIIGRAKKAELRGCSDTFKSK